MRDTVFPYLLPLFPFRQYIPQKRFCFPEILFEFFLADVDGELVEYFNNIVYRNRRIGFVVGSIPGKQIQVSKQSNLK